MEFEWNENKSRINKSKRGIDYNTATEIWKYQNRIENKTKFKTEKKNNQNAKIKDKNWNKIFNQPM